MAVGADVESLAATSLSGSCSFSDIMLVCRFIEAVIMQLVAVYGLLAGQGQVVMTL